MPMSILRNGSGPSHLPPIEDFEDHREFRDESGEYVGLFGHESRVGFLLFPIQQPEGYYSASEAPDEATHRGRIRFLRILKWREPRIVEELHGLPSEAFGRLPESYRSSLVELHKIPGGFLVCPLVQDVVESLCDQRKQSEAERALIGSVREWAKDAGLDVKWIWDEALFCLWAGCLCDEPASRFWSLRPIEGSPPFPGETGQRVVQLTWDPRVPERDARRHTRARIDSEFDAVVEDRTKALANRGWPKVPRIPSNRNLDWLIRYQVIGTPKSTIAHEDDRSFNGVSEGIDRAALAIGLPLRTAERGRPPNIEAN